MKIIRVIIGLILLPCCAAISRTVYFLVSAPAAGGEGGLLTFWMAAGAGFLLWLLLFVFLPAPVKSYVLAHELTHALWGGLFGASLLSMRVSRTGGSVKLSESNFLVVLAPYFFPLYAIVAICAYFLASVFFDLDKYRPFLMALIGFTMGYHIFFTVSVLGQKQDDIARYGRFFSYALIYFMNALVISLVIVAVAPVTINQFVARLAFDFMDVRNLIWGGILRLSGVIQRCL